MNIKLKILVIESVSLTVVVVIASCQQLQGLGTKLVTSFVGIVGKL